MFLRRDRTFIPSARKRRRGPFRPRPRLATALLPISACHNLRPMAPTSTIQSSYFSPSASRHLEPLFRQHTQRAFPWPQTFYSESDLLAERVSQPSRPSTVPPHPHPRPRYEAPISSVPRLFPGNEIESARTRKKREPRNSLPTAFRTTDVPFA
jgi:hypothetical protein